MRTGSKAISTIILYIVCSVSPRCSKAQASLNDQNYRSMLGTLSAQTVPSGQAASGTITWSASARYTAATQAETATYLSRGCATADISKCGVLALMFWVDGSLQSVQLGTADATVSVDTTTLSNGQHEFVTTAWSDGTYSQLIGVTQVLIAIDNGRVPLAVSSGWSEIDLAPGQTQTLAAKLVYTNGEQDALTDGLIFQSDTPGVAAVTADGVVRAISAGVAVVTMNAQGKSAQTRVIVDVPAGFPHLSKSGQVLNQYDASRSQFLRSIFGVTIAEVSSNPSLVSSAESAGLNALTAALYSNPADNQAADFASWKAGWDGAWNQNVQIAGSNHMSLFFVGDDIARQPYELSNSISNAWSANAIQYAFTTARASGLAVGVDMVDEVSFLWGDTPTPTGNPWLSLSPPIPNDAFVRLMSIISGASSRIPISWPAGGLASNAAVQNWNGNPTFSDYTSHYWDSQDFRDEYYYSGKSLKQIQTWMAGTIYSRQAYVQRNRPQICLISATGPFYTKMVNGNNFNQSSDVLQRSGSGPEQVMAQITLAAVTGMSGVRVYNYDTSAWQAERAAAPLGTGDLQTGIAGGSPPWNAMSLAFNFISQIEPSLLQQKISAVDLGGNIETTARTGSNGTLLMAVNMSEAPQPVVANLQPYQPSGNIIRYRLTTAGLVKQVIPNAATDNLTFQPGETVAWSFQQGSSAPALSSLLCSPAIIVGPGASTCTVSVSAPAPAGGLSIGLSSNSPILTAPASVTVPGGANSATFAVSAAAVSISTPVQLMASLNGTSQTFVLTLGPVVPTVTSVVNGASLSAGPVAPGEVVSIFGAGIGPQTGAGIVLTSDGLVSTSVANTRVLFDGTPAPLIFVRTDQINAVVPYEVSGNANTQMQVEYQGVRSQAVSIAVTDTSPAIFTLNASGQGQGAILNTDGTTNSLINPAARGSVVVLYGTGAGQTDPPGVDGAVATGVLPKPRLPVSVNIDGKVAEILYEGAAPQEVAGVLQINAVVPSTAASGVVQVSLTIGTNTSRSPVVLAVQ